MEEVLRKQLSHWKVICISMQMTHGKQGKRFEKDGSTVMPPGTLGIRQGTSSVHGPKGLIDGENEFSSGDFDRMNCCLIRVCLYLWSRCVI